MIGDQPLFDPVRGESEPDRFWTTTNIAEATPLLLSPLCWDLWSVWDQAWLNAMRDFGLLSPAESVSSDDPNKKAMGVIYGRQAANVDVIRRVMGRLPGVKPDDVEQSLLGSVRPNLPPEEGAGRRLPVVAVKLPWVMLQTKAMVRRMHDDNRAWWIGAVSSPTSESDPIRLLEASRDRFVVAAELHSRIRFLLPVAERVVASTARLAGITDATSLIGGLGGVSETALAEDLWQVSQDRLTFREFMNEHGFHGPNEGNVYTRSWREQPERVTAMVDSYRRRDDVVRPRDLEKAAIRAKDAVLNGVPRPKRIPLKLALDRLGSLVRSMELTKASYLRALDGARAGARIIDADLRDRGLLSEPDDAFFLTIAELRRLHATDDGAAAKALVGYRRAERERYSASPLQISFTGMPDLDTRQDPVRSGDAQGAAEIVGAAGGCGVVEGRARVVLDPNDDVDLQPGDVLVCRYTDPSWAPLFVCAAALVIDLGTAVSHGAVVARELGIPYVIGTGNGTSLIREGDRIHVDGPERSVAVLSRQSAVGLGES